MKKLLLCILVVLGTLSSGLSIGSPAIVIKAQPRVEDIYQKTIKLERETLAKFAEVELIAGRNYLFKLQPLTKNGTPPFGIRLKFEVRDIKGNLVRKIAIQGLLTDDFQPPATGKYLINVSYSQEFSGPENGLVDAFKATAIVYLRNNL